MKSLLKTIKTTFSRELVGHIAARLGESEIGISKALHGLLPIVLGGIIGIAGSGDERLVYERGMQAFCTVDANLGSVTGLLGIMGSGMAPSSVLAQSADLHVAMFGAATASIREAVRNYAGIKAASTEAVLNLVGAVQLALLGQHAVKYQLRPQALNTALLSLQATVREMVPLGLRGLAGAHLLATNGSTVRRANPDSSEPELASARQNKASGTSRWYQALLALVGTVVLLLSQLCCPLNLLTYSTHGAAGTSPCCTAEKDTCCSQ